MGPNVDVGDEMDLHIGYENELVAWSEIIACSLYDYKKLWQIKNINLTVFALFEKVVKRYIFHSISM